MFTTPILFLIFNRPEQTEIVFKEIRRQRPQYLYIASDGPRENNADDLRLNKQCKEIVSQINWPCEAKTLYRDKNMGCGAAPADAITWFFNNVEEGIILEDDCVPNSSFFTYCEALLYKYRNTPEVMMICGTSYQPKVLNTDSYYFSKYPHVWGWATWKRAWAKYSFKLDTEDESTRTSVINSTFSHSRERKFWLKNTAMIVDGLDAWDYQWMYWMWKSNGLCITPWENMIANIGFGKHATHTFDRSSSQANMVQHELSVIKHPQHIALNRKADHYERFHILIYSNGTRLKVRLHSVLKRITKLFAAAND